MKKIHKIMLAGLGLIVIFLATFFGLLIHRNYRELRVIEDLEAQRQDEASALAHKLADNERYIDLIENDDTFREWVVRQRLGYTNHNETVFRFED